MLFIFALEISYLVFLIIKLIVKIKFLAYANCYVSF